MWSMWSRFQTGSNMPLAKRRARMFSTDSLPRKWSIRNTSRSGKAEWRTLFSSRADAASQPNGFSTITRARVDSPSSPSRSTTLSNADGGIARWKSRRGRPPISLSARATTSATASWSAPKMRWVKLTRSEALLFFGPNICSDSSAVARISSSLSSPRDTPTIRKRCGISPTDIRWKRPGRIFRLARSPVAPYRTMTWFGGRSYLRRDIGCDLARERPVGGPRVVLPEDGAAGDEEIGACVAHRPRVFGVDPAVDLHVHALRQQAPQLLDPPERVRHELLTREPRMDAHAEREVCALCRPGGGGDVGLGIEGDAGAEAELARTGDRARGIVGHLGVEGDAVAP